MSSLTYDSSPGPVITARRVLLMRRLLHRAIEHYKATLAFCEEIDAQMPEDFRHDPSLRERAEGECGAWWRLLKAAEGDHYSAEGELAEMICNMFDDLAPEDRRVGPEKVGTAFQERGVSVDGVLYVLVDDPGGFEAGKPIIARVPSDRVIDLDI